MKPGQKCLKPLLTIITLYKPLFQAFNGYSSTGIYQKFRYFIFSITSFKPSVKHSVHYADYGLSKSKTDKEGFALGLG